MRAPGILFVISLLLILQGLASGQLPQSDSGSTDRVWIISDVVHCRDETWRETRAILIYGAGRLILEGCDLVVASPPYEDQWLGAAEDGVTIHVLLGGTLEMVNSGSRPARLIPDPDAPQYGYRVDVNGVFRSDGKADQPNVIRGLEGYMAEGNIGGGIRVFGNGKAFLNYTEVEDIQGPALFVQGGDAEAHGVTVENASGAFAAVDGNLVLEDVRVNTGIEAIRVTRSNLTMRNVYAASDRAAVYATNSRLDIVDSTLFAYRNAIVLDDADLALANSSLTFGSMGLVGRHNEVRRAMGPIVDIENSTFKGLPGQSTLALSTLDSNVTVNNSTFVNHTAGAVSVVAGGLQVTGTDFDGTSVTDVFAMDVRSWSIAGNGYSANASRPVRILFGVDVTVVDSDGDPLAGATAALGRSNGTTGSDGKIRLYLEPELSPDLQLLAGEAVVAVAKGGDSAMASLQPGQRAVTIELGKDGLGVPAPGLSLLATALAAGALLLRRRTR